MPKIMALLIMAMGSTTVLAQENGVASQDVMRSNGKIYVVVAVVVVILIGLFIYVWRIDRKISKMEEEN